MPDAIPDDRITFNEIAMKPDGEINRATKSRLTNLGRILFKGYNGNEEDEDEGGPVIDSVYYQLRKLAEHQLTLGGTFEGQEILEAVQDVKAAIVILNAKMAAVQGLRYPINQGD